MGSGEIDSGEEGAEVETSMTKGFISEAERNVITDATSARLETIRVDAFDPDEYRTLRG